MKRWTKTLLVAAWIATTLLAGALAGASDHGDAAAHYREAEAHADAGEPEAAFAAARRAVELDPDNVTYLRGLARLAGWTGDYETAHDAWRRVLEARADDGEAALGLARTAAWSGRTDAAARLYRDYVERHPEDADARLEYARVTAWQGNAAAALEILETYRRDFGPSEAYQEDRAMALTAAARADTALEILAPLVETDPASPRRQRLYTMALSAGHRPASALDNLETVLRLEPESPATRETERLVATPLRSTFTPLFDLYSDSDSVDVVRFGLEGALTLSTRSRLSLGGASEELRAGASSGLGARGGGDVRASSAWLGLSHRFSPRAWAEARLGETDVDGGGELTTYRLGLRFDPGDAWSLELERHRGFYAVSPRALDLGIHRTGNQLRLDWSPGPRYHVEVDGAYDELSDGNRRWELSLAPRRQALRRQHFNLDLGLRGWWFGFDDDPGNGYYSPGSYERYAATAFGYWKWNDQNGVGVVASLGWFQDDTMDSFRFGGDLAVEGTFGVYGDWMLVVRVGATENSRLQSGAFSAYGGHVALTRRFGRPPRSYDPAVTPLPAPPASVGMVAEADPPPAAPTTLAEPEPPPVTPPSMPEPVVATPHAMPPAAVMVEREEGVPVVEPTATVAEAARPDKIFELQLALFHRETNAHSFVEELGVHGFRPYLVEVLSSQGEPRYTVRIGPYASMDEAALQASKIREELDLASVIRYRWDSR